VVPGSLRIFNFSARAFDLTFVPDDGEASPEPYRVPSMDRLMSLLGKIGVSLSDHEMQVLRSGSHLTKQVELHERDCRTFFGGHAS
jgi:hypothetical protein